jgi:tyrosyl-tRNA synthetase
MICGRMPIMEEQHRKQLYSRGVAQFTDPEKRLETFLGVPKGERPPFVIKFGVDPTRPDIHLGHAVVLHKLRALQDEGALVVFLIGDFTAMIGDPTGKSKVRPEISQQEVEENMKTYLEQVGRILDLDPKKFSWIRNSDWFSSPMDILADEKRQISIDGKPVTSGSFLGKAIAFERTRMQVTHLGHKEVHNVSLINFLAILRRLTYARLIERDMFQKRLKDNEELYLHEMMYPVFQAIDSHVIARVYGSCDMEIGGSDQTFNMLMGRDVMKACAQPPQAVMAMDLLEGTDGGEKMSKSLGNYIGIIDEPSDMYGKVMSIPDAIMGRYLELGTFTPTEEISEILEGVKKGTKHPRDVKMSIARQLVAIYHGEKRAGEAEQDFVKTFQEGGLPKEIPVYQMVGGEDVIDTLIRVEVFASRTIAKRHFSEGAIQVHEGEKITDPGYIPKEEVVIRIGKKTFVRIKPA